MQTQTDSVWLESIVQTVDSYRKMIEAIIEQLSDEELFQRPQPMFNSVANILRHLGGNLQSRWKDFLATDGEKPNRNRDLEFQDWEGDRSSLIAYFDEGWQCLTLAIAQLDQTNITQQILIRGEPHTIPRAITRSLAHISYHVGQAAIVARMVHQGHWKWLTIPPGGSKQHNERTWGRPASRSVFAEDKTRKK